MNGRNARRLFILGGFVVAAMLAAPKPVFAHCDGMDGPVVKAAQKALATGNVDLVLIRVQPKPEGLREGGEHGTGHAHGAGEAAHKPEGGQATMFGIPQPLKLEHEELHEELVKATQEPGEIGEAAKAVARVLHPHFVKEEEYALPPLGLLAPLAAGKVTPEVKTAISMTDRLKAELPHMLQEHQNIVAALETLAEAAGKGGKPQYARFAEKLKLHAQTEEQVLYPAAILVGEYLKVKGSH